jgi:hypothetical protein
VTQEEILGETRETEDPPEIRETAAVRLEALRMAWLRWTSMAEARLPGRTLQILMGDVRICEDRLRADLPR